MKKTANKLTRIEQAFYSQMGRAQKARFTELYNKEGRASAIKYAVRIVQSIRDSADKQALADATMILKGVYFE